MDDFKLHKQPDKQPADQLNEEWDRIYDKRFDKQFDELWSSSLEQTYYVEIPDPDASWDEVSRKLNEDLERRTKRKRVRMTAAISASFLIGALLFSEPLQTKAYLPKLKIVENVKGGIVSIFYGVTEDDPKKALTYPPPEVEGDSSQTGPIIGEVEKAGGYFELTSIAEAQEKMPFAIRVPEYIPEGYALEKATVSASDEAMLYVVDLMYLNQQKIPITITQKMMVEGDRISIEGQLQPGDKEPVQIDGKHGVLFLMENGFTKLFWVDGNMNFTVNGKLSKEEAIKIATHL